MVREYQPKQFFRDVPDQFLKRYFTHEGVLTDFPFGTLQKKARVEALYAAWLGLTEQTRDSFERRFQEINELATESGSRAIFDLALTQGENLGPFFVSLPGFHERAFWTCLERPNYWDGALSLHRADMLSLRRWRRRKNMPRQLPRTGELYLHQFEVEIAEYFFVSQGRGQQCKVEYYKRGDRDYFFAYPADYAHAESVWRGGQLSRSSRRPAFDVIFVYCEKERTLDIFLSGDRKPIPRLQAVFAKLILNAELVPDAKDERVFDLEPLRVSTFQFRIDNTPAISGVEVTKLRLTVADTLERIVLERGPDQSGQAVYELLGKITKAVPGSRIYITQVGLRVTFVEDPETGKQTARSFDLGYPNSCSLRFDGADGEIRKMLAASGIEPGESDSKKGAISRDKKRIAASDSRKASPV